MYNQYVRNYEKMNEFFYGYGERWKAINELFVEASQNFIKINEKYIELFKAGEDVHALIVAYIELEFLGVLLYRMFRYKTSKGQNTKKTRITALPTGRFVASVMMFAAIVLCGLL
jgi:hypothetical protein